MFRSEVRDRDAFNEMHVNHKQFEKHLNDVKMSHKRKKMLCDEISDKTGYDISRFYKNYEDKKEDQDPNKVKE